MTRPRVLVATRSPHKLAEIREILSDVAVDFLSLDDVGLPPERDEADLEPHETFAANALSKARHFHGRSGLPTVADDSGLCVNALGGGPGIRTKRFAPAELADRLGRDEANNRYLLERLEGVSESRRTAHYRCAVAAVSAGVEPLVAEGAVHGRIARTPRGAGGFGYDPLFIPDGERRTFAALRPEVKRRTSHRARALEGLRPWLAFLARHRDPSDPHTEEDR